MLPLLAAGLFSVRPATAQKYRAAAGMRLSPGLYGLTVQQKFLPKATLEGLALAGPREITGTVLAERHFGILGPSLNYYIGAGGHVGNNKDTGAFGGVDAIVGVEYKIALSRLVISADFKPSVEFNSDDWARFPTAFSIRYVIIKDKSSIFDGVFGGDKKKKSKSKSKSKAKSGSGRGLFDF